VARSEGYLWGLRRRRSVGNRDDPSTHQGYECGYVLAGKVEVTFGDEVFRSALGKAPRIRVHHWHILRNPGPEIFEGIWFVRGRMH
jgi:mannose-6-phosphate isomerase-like protein (cupin superfamily)